MNELSISVVLPTHNRAMFIDRAIVSVLGQLRKTDEFIIVDDGSSDDTKNVVLKYGKRIKYIKTKNKGAGSARNRGIQECKKDLICFIDSDDEWLPNKINIQRQFMSIRKDVLFCFTNFAFSTKQGLIKRYTLNTWHNDKRTWDNILNKGNKITDIIDLPDDFDEFYYYIGDIYLSALLYGNYLNVNTLMVRRIETLNQIKFAEDINVYEEYECLARISRLGKCCYMDCEMARQHAHNEPRLTDADGYERNEAQLKVIERVWGNDTVFLANYRKQYDNIIEGKRHNRIGYHIFNGDKSIAANEIKKVQYCPLKYRLLIKLPDKMNKNLGKMRNKILKKLKTAINRS